MDQSEGHRVPTSRELLLVHAAVSTIRIETKWVRKTSAPCPQSFFLVSYLANQVVEGFGGKPTGAQGIHSIEGRALAVSYMP